MTTGAVREKHKSIIQMEFTSESLNVRACDPASLFLRDGGSRRAQLEGAFTSGVERCRAAASNGESRALEAAPDGPRDGGREGGREPGA